MVLDVTSIVFHYNSQPVLDDVTFRIAEGRLVSIVGPNGSGKSTLLQVISRALTPKHGQVMLDNCLVTRMTPKELAFRLSVVRQHETTAFNFTVAQVVMMGRLPYLGAFGKENRDDHKAVDEAMASAGVTHLATRPVLELSGGEFQRVALARALAQKTPILLLDEPTSSLDLKHQIQVLQLLRQLAQAGRTIVVTLHDLNLAGQYCDDLLVLHHGRIQAAGAPHDVLNPTLIHEVYGVGATVAPHPVTGKPYVYPHFNL